MRPYVQKYTKVLFYQKKKNTSVYKKKNQIRKSLKNWNYSPSRRQVSYLWNTEFRIEQDYKAQIKQVQKHEFWNGRDLWYIANA